MSDLYFWENQRLIKEFQFVEAEFNYVQELIKSVQPIFLQAVAELTKERPSLIDTISVLSENEEVDEVSEINFDNSENILNFVVDDKSDLKNLYRQIAKKTHPDRASNLENVYLSATQAYGEGDLVKIVQIGWDLKIDFEWNDLLRQEISDRISLLRQKRNFLEHGYIYQWLKAGDEIKPSVVLSYISNQVL